MSYVSHRNVVAILGPVVELDDTVRAVYAEEQTSGALVVAVNDHDAIALLWHNWLQVLHGNVNCLVQLSNMHRALTSLLVENYKIMYLLGFEFDILTC